MQAATQIDLARDEATPQEVLRSPLHATLITDTDNDTSSNASSDSASRTTQRSMRGGLATTGPPVRLIPKQSGARSSTTHGQINDPADGAGGDFCETDNSFELMPMDTGFGAWSYATAAFAMYIVVWGFPYSFPIFQTHLSTGPKAQYPDSVVLRLLAPGIQDILEGLLFPVLPAAGRHRLFLVISGILIILASLLLASYSTEAWQVVLCQGVLFGIGGIMLNFVHVSVFSEWFDKKKGTAMGMIWTGYRLGALAFPLICQWLLDRHGFAQTIRVLLPPMLTLLAPAIVLLRGRYHGSSVSVEPPVPGITKIQALRKPAVLYYLFACTLYFLTVNLPKMFITTLAADLGLTGSSQAASLVLLTLSEMHVTYLCGWLSDKHDHGVMLGLLAISTGLGNILGLGLATSKGAVFAYAIGIGMASGGFSNFLFNFYGDISKGNGELFTAIHGLFSFFRGLSILSVGPVGAALLQHSPAVDHTCFAVGRYKSLLVYSVTTTLASGVLILVKTIGPRVWSYTRKPGILK